MLLALGLSVGCDKIVTLDPPPSCPANYTQEAHGFYRPSVNPMMWADADADCKLDRDVAQVDGHTHLAVVASEDELTSLEVTTGPHVWIGLTDLAREGQFAWITKESAQIMPFYPPISGPPWAVNEPNDRDGAEDCVELRLDSRDLNDASCTDQKDYVCECDDFAESP